MRSWRFGFPFRRFTFAHSNNTGRFMDKPRTSLLEALISRRRAPEPLRRADFKGERRRMSLRLKKRTVFDLEVIKVATGEDKTAFIERHLDIAIQTKIKELKGQHAEEAWEFILARAAARTG
jgi:hypothetical protein